MIRAIEPGDRAVWEALWKAYLAFYETVLPEEVHASTWSRLLDANEPTWGALALRDGVPVGLVHGLYHRSNWTIADACYLQDLFVAPEGRGKGLGSALIQHAADQAAAAGCPRIYWLTHESNATARALYDKGAQRSGFIQYRRNLPAS